MVDSLIGNVLRGNIFTDTAPYQAMVLKSPEGILAPAMVRGDIYQGPPVPPSIAGHAATVPALNTLIPREEIYDKSDSLNRVGNPINALADFHSSIEQNQDFSKGMSFDPGKRADIYTITKRDEQIRSNIAGTERSKLTLGDAKGLAGLPPVKSLNEINVSDARKDFAPPEGRIASDEYHRGNQYDDGDVNFFARGGGYKLFPAEVGPLRFFDIIATAHWLRGIGREVLFVPRNDGTPSNPDKSVGRTDETIGKSVQWLASQFLLTSMNTGDPQAYGVGNLIWNPLSMPLSAVPLLRVLTPVTNITAGAVLGTYEERARISVNASPGGQASPGTGERLLLMRQGMYSEVAPVARLSKGHSPIAKPGFIGDLAAVGKVHTLEDEKILIAQGTTIQDQVDGDDFSPSKGALHTNIYNIERPYSERTAIMPLEKMEQIIVPYPASEEKLSALFVRSAPYPGGGIEAAQPKAWIAKRRIGQTDGMKQTADSPGINVVNSMDMAFLDDAANAGTPAEGTSPKLIDEDKNYMPFMFEDLRMDPPQYLYFRAFLKSGLSEMFSPEWQITRYFGRVDQVPVYMGTNRTLNVSFDVVSWSPKDLNVMYKKLKKLQAMVYPMYDTQGFMSRGPIVRMRIGDLIANSSGRGLPGYITSMNWAYDDGIWNIEPGSKVPRKMSVSISFTVLHEGNPGIYPYEKNTFDIVANTNTAGNTPENVFGVGKVTADANANTVSTEVNAGDIRKIFGPAGGGGGSGG
jgi:hypothetical protein